MRLGSLAYREYSQSFQALELVDLLTEVKNVLGRSFRDAIWIIAEVNNINRNNYSGHYYLELVQNEAGKILAKSNATLFAGVAHKVLPLFQNVTGTEIQPGMQLMLLVKVVHSPQWGFSLNILDVNPEYTLGQHERIKKETIKRLYAEGIWDLNKTYKLPTLIQRVAVISSETAAGLGDFIRQIEQSKVGKLIRIDVFPAVMQGQATTRSVCDALMSIFHRLNEFDAIVIIRGGGSKLDLAAFDDYNLCCYIANFPAPIITGIGHERDESVADMISNTSLKTPTAVADFLIRRMELAVTQIFSAEDKLENYLLSYLEKINNQSKLISQRCKHALLSLDKLAEQQLSGYASFLHEHLNIFMVQSLNIIEKIQDNLFKQLTDVTKTFDITKHALRLSHQLNMVHSRIESYNNHLLQCSNRTERFLAPIEQELLQKQAIYEQLIRLHDPRNIMKKGFLPVLKNDQSPVSEVKSLKKGDSIKILMLDGSVITKVDNIKQNE